MVQPRSGILFTHKKEWSVLVQDKWTSKTQGEFSPQGAESVPKLSCGHTYTTPRILKTIEWYTLNGKMLWHINDSSLKLLKTRPWRKDKLKGVQACLLGSCPFLVMAYLLRGLLQLWRELTWFNTHLYHFLIKQPWKSPDFSKSLFPYWKIGMITELLQGLMQSGVDILFGSVNILQMLIILQWIVNVLLGCKTCEIFSKFLVSILSSMIIN